MNRTHHIWNIFLIISLISVLNCEFEKTVQTNENDSNEDLKYLNSLDQRIEQFGKIDKNSPNSSQTDVSNKKSGIIKNMLNVSETCEGIFNVSSLSQNSINYSAPSNFSSAQSKIWLDVLNASLMTNIVEDLPSTGELVQSTQAFSFSTDVYLENISIYLSGVKSANRRWEIRNNTFNGTMLYTGTVTLPSTNSWMNISIPTRLFFAPGKYFLWMDTPLKNERLWFHSEPGDNQTDTWYYDTNTGEWVSANYDLTLKVYYVKCVEPESVEMTLDDQIIHNLGHGKGVVELETNITSNQVTHVIHANSSIQVQYSVAAQFFKHSSYSSSYNFTNSIPRWNTSLNLAYPIALFSNYDVNVTGFSANFDNLDLINENQTQIFPKSSSFNSIIFTEEVSEIFWNSPNYIQAYQVPSTVYSGEIIQINTTLKTSGNYSIEIKDMNGVLIYSNNSFGSIENMQIWNVNTILPAGQYNITWFFNETFGLGFAESNFILVKQAIISSNEINAYVFDQITIQNTMIDRYSSTPLSSATMTYSLDMLSDTMEENPILNGQYSHEIDLSLFALTPGDYIIYYKGEKTGYQTAMATTRLHLAPRPIQLEIVQNQVSIIPGKSINFEINVGENSTLEPLHRPITIAFSIEVTSTNGVTNTVYSKIISGVSQQTKFTWDTDVSLEPGQYQIKAEIQSQFYVVSQNSVKTLTIMDPNVIAQQQYQTNMTILASTLIPLALVLVITFNFIKPYKRRKLNEQIKRTEIIDDATNLKGFLIISKESGVCTWTYLINKMQGDTSLVSGFLQALFIFSSQFGNESPELDNDIGGYIPEHENNVVEFDVSPNNEAIIDPKVPIPSESDFDPKPFSNENQEITENDHPSSEMEDILEYNYNNRNFLIISGKYLRFVVILTGRASSEIRFKAQTFIQRFETENQELVHEWKGDVDSFKKPASDLIQSLFPLVYTKLFAFSKSNIVEEFKQTLLRKERSHKKQILHIFSVMDSLIQTQLSFKISTILSLLQESDKLFAKDLILKMVTQNILVEFVPTTSQITKFNPHIRIKKI